MEGEKAGQARAASQAERVAEQEVGSKISAWRASHRVNVTR